MKPQGEFQMRNRLMGRSLRWCAASLSVALAQTSQKAGKLQSPDGSIDQRLEQEYGGDRGALPTRLADTTFMSSYLLSPAETPDEPWAEAKFNAAKPNVDPTQSR